MVGGARRGMVRLSAAGGGMGAAGFFLFYLRSRGRAGFVDKCWCVRSSGAFAPHPPLFCLRVAGKNLRGHKEAAAWRVVVCGGGVF